MPFVQVLPHGGLDLLDALLLAFLLPGRSSGKVRFRVEGASPTSFSTSRQYSGSEVNWSQAIDRPFLQVRAGPGQIHFGDQDANIIVVFTVHLR